MKTWDYGINSHPEHMLGTITLYRQPWWLSLAEWFAFWICWDWLHKIELPRWPLISWTPEDRCSPHEWYGDLGCMINVTVTNPLNQWVWQHPRNRRLQVELGYARCREMFYADNPEMFDEEANIGKDAA